MKLTQTFRSSDRRLPADLPATLACLRSGAALTLTLSVLFVVPATAEAGLRLYPYGAELDCYPSDLIPLTDGGYITNCGPRVVRVTSPGRRTDLPGRVRGSNVKDLALMPDGGVLVVEGGDADPPRVRRIGPDGRVTTVAGGGDAWPGDGGPATAANLGSGLKGVAAMPDGSFLIAGTNRVQRVTPNGVINTVAGTGSRGTTHYGVDARTTAIRDPARVAAAPDGSFVVLAANGVSRVDSDGLIWLVTKKPTVMSEAGALYEVSGEGYAKGGVRLSELTPGKRTPILGGGHRSGFFSGFGDPAQTSWLAEAGGPFSFGLDDVERMADGTLMMVGDRWPAAGAPVLALLEGSRRFAVALARESIPAAARPTRMSIVVRSTRRARARIELLKGNRQVARVSGDLRPALTRLRLPGRLRPGLYKVVLDARTPEGWLAGDEQFMLLGGNLPASIAADAMDEAVSFLNLYPAAKALRPLYDTTTERVSDCRRFGARRVDCYSSGWDEGDELSLIARCIRVLSIQLRPNGYLYTRPYGCKRRAGRWTRRNPTWRARAIQAPPLESITP